MLALQSPHIIHGTVERAFSGGRERRLWRLDSLGGQLYLLVLSEEKPDLSHADAQFGTGKGWETLPYEPLLNRIVEGTRWHFRLTANPTFSEKPNGRDSRGKVHAHITPNLQEKWLLDRAANCGMEIARFSFPNRTENGTPQMQESSLVVTGSKWYQFRKEGKGRIVSLLAVSYEGTLLVTDAERFRKAMTEGIGRGKAYGMGLLTVAREG